MKFVPKSERTAWHEKAMDAAKATISTPSVGLFQETKEMKRPGGIGARRHG